MKTPSLFAHYWSENETLTTFQEVMNWDINPIIIEIIQTEISHQLNSDFIQHTFPNFNWESNRFTEKWSSAMQSLLTNVTIPEKIWLDWIQDLTNKTIGTTEESKPATLEEVYPSFDELLNAEVYYSSPADSLEDMPEDALIEEVVEINEEVKITFEEEEEEEEETKKEEFKETETSVDELFKTKLDTREEKKKPSLIPLNFLSNLKWNNNYLWVLLIIPLIFLVFIINRFIKSKRTNNNNFQSFMENDFSSLPPIPLETSSKLDTDNEYSEPLKIQRWDNSLGKD